MRYFTVALFIVAAAASAFGQHQHTPKTEQKPASLIDGLGDLHHPVSTKNALAQQFFDQGMKLVYAFNHEEAIRSFKQAAELDPKLAMAHWGIALALGPNINMDIDPQRENDAFEAVRKAVSLSDTAPENERAYIKALATRYSIDPKADLKALAAEYKDAMKELTERYPDDLDAATLYAESLMDLHPWQLWSGDGKPTEGTEEIVAVLESVLRRNPRHIGANHYYIHAVEASQHPEWALSSAERLKGLAPAAGHLTHMPAHIFARVGDFQAAAESNVKGAAADQQYFKTNGSAGMYPVMYYTHNLHFLTVARSMEGRFADASAAASQLQSFLDPYQKNIDKTPEFMPMIDGFAPTKMLVMVKFRRWADVLKLPEPDRRLPATHALWHFAQGSALAATGHASQAESRLNAFKAEQKAVPPDALYGLNAAGNVLKVAENVLAARVSLARGDRKAAIASLRKGAAAEDALSYDEPPGWYMPVRESLGAVLIADGNAAAAEQVFRADLTRNRGNGRSLFGLMESLRLQGKIPDTRFVKDQFDTAWKNADTHLSLKDLE